jgi:murein tripeptide amidase MpaA
MLRMLLDRKDHRAQLLRKYFVFMVIPMLNPDGVYRGHYRMDYFGQNLNRYYDKPTPERTPSCYAVRRLVEYLNTEKRLENGFFFF